MTVIAWDGKTLAADKRACTADGAIAITTKIERFGKALLASSGNAPVGRELREWFKAGADPERFPESNRDDKASLIVITTAGVDLYTMGPFPVREEQARASFGCGRDYADAFMACGKTAAEAVALTCEYNAYCGNGIDTLELNP